jgi:hypothetical protein
LRFSLVFDCSLMGYDTINMTVVYKHFTGTCWLNEYLPQRLWQQVPLKMVVSAYETTQYHNPGR